MDTPTHGLIGRLVARSVWPGHEHRGLVNLATLCSVLPDADVFLPGDPLERLTTHRGFTHSILGAIVISGIVALAARRFGMKKVPLQVTYLASLGGMLFHILFDWFTSYGTMVFQPFTRYRAASDVLFIIDPYLTLIVIAGLTAGWKLARIRSTGYRTGAGVMAAYVLMNAAVTGAGLWHVDRWAKREHIEVHSVSSLPVPFSPLWRRGVLESGGTAYDLSVSAFRGVVGTPVAHRMALPDPRLRDLWSTREGSIYRWFSRFPVIAEDSAEKIVIQDLRFVFRPDGLGWLGTWAAKTAVDHNPEFFDQRRFTLKVRINDDGSLSNIVYGGSPIDRQPD